MVSRSELLKQLGGQTLRIHGLRTAFIEWPFETNQHLDQVRLDVRNMLKSRFPHHSKLQKLLAGDYGLFGSTWWPHASLERLRIATYLSIWLFMWDDELDSDIGSLSGDFELGQAYRAETLDFVTNRLGLGSSTEPTRSHNAIINSFDVIGDALCDSCSVERRQSFLHELKFFMLKSETEQRLRLENRALTTEEFLRYRLGTSANYRRAIAYFTRYCNNTELPKSVTQDPDFVALWDLINLNICNVNDLLSVNKELAQGSTESLIPILHVELGSVQKAVNEVMRMILLTMKEFNDFAERLKQRHLDDETVTRALDEFICGCRYYCTGNLSWSLKTNRYGVLQDLDANTVTIVLDHVK